MADIAEHVATGTGLCLECSGDVAPGIILIQLVLFIIGAGLASFDTYTDWEVVLTFRDVGFNNPLLPLNENWLRAWFLFAAVGTFLTAFAILHDGVDLLYSMWLAFKKCCCKSRSRPINRLEAEDDDEDEIDDPLKCCYACGCNPVTRAETLSFFTLWFQDVPMLTMAILYALSQATCKVPEERDVSDVLLSVGISAMAAIAAASYRLFRSIFRLCVTVGVRIRSKGCGQGKDSGKWSRRISKWLPKSGDAAYPPGKRAQCCIVPFYASVIFHFVAINLAAVATLVVWIYYIVSRTAVFDDSLAIYRFPDNVHLINISNNIIPQRENETLLTIESIPFGDDGEFIVHCFSEFQYSEEDSEIYFNTIELEVVSLKGQFCANKTDERGSFCRPFYTYKNIALFYGFLDPTDGMVKRFDDECTEIKDIYPKVYAGPKRDPNIQVDRHIGTTFNNNELCIISINATLLLQTNGELRVLYSVPVNKFIDEVFGFTFFHTFQDPDTGGDVNCAIRLNYDFYYYRVSYNMRQVFNYPPPPGDTCTCSPYFQINDCYQFLDHQLPLYGYYPNDNLTSTPVLLLKCGTLSVTRIIPHFDTSLAVACSRINCIES